MPITIPPAANYPGPLLSMGMSDGEPPEGRRIVPVELNWGATYAASGCVAFNLQNYQQLNFSKIRAISVDNSQCGADVRFIFPDTNEYTTIPAYSPKTIIEVFTNQTQFFVQALGQISADVTNFSMLNYVPPPVSVSVSQEQNNASVNNINGTTVADTVLVANTMFGTLEDAVISLLPAGGSGDRSTWVIKDGTGKIILAGGNTGDTTGIQSGPNLNNVHVRFQQGLIFSITSSTLAAGATYSANLYYRTP